MIRAIDVSEESWMLKARTTTRACESICTTDMRAPTRLARKTEYCRTAGP